VLQCVVHGRPPTLNIAHSDCRFPRDLDPYQLPSGNSELGCKQLLLGPTSFQVLTPAISSSVHSWKFRYAAVCLSASVQHTFSVRRESYSSILELDKRIRSFPVPAHLLCPAHETGGRDWDANPCHAMQQFFAACDRESSEYPSVLPSLLDELITTSMHRPNIRPQILVRRSTAGLGRPTTAQVRPIRSYSLSQRECLGQWLEKPYERAPQGGRPRLVLLVQFLHVVGTHVIPVCVSPLFTGCQGSTRGDCGQEPWLQARAQRFDAARSVFGSLRRRIEAVSPARNYGTN
jgi:hypothetical protein